MTYQSHMFPAGDDLPIFTGQAPSNTRYNATGYTPSDYYTQLRLEDTQMNTYKLVAEPHNIGWAPPEWLVRAHDIDADAEIVQMDDDAHGHVVYELYSSQDLSSLTTAYGVVSVQESDTMNTWQEEAIRTGGIQYTIINSHESTSK